MKTLSTVLLLGLMTHAISQDERPTTSQIKEVTVFLTGAQVTRTANLEVPAGTTTWVISGLSPRVNEQSIQAEIHESIKILSVSYRINHLKEIKKSDQITFLEGEQVRLGKLIEADRNTSEVFKEEELMLKANKSIGGEQQGVSIVELKQAVDYFRTRMIDIKNLQLQNQQRLSEYNLALQKIESELSELKNMKAQPSGEIVIKTSAKGAIRTTLTLSYLVNEAGWHPSYDVRALNVQSPIRLTYKANITQHSGEDWNQVKLTISSANPSATGARPILNTWFLGLNNNLASYNVENALQGALYGLSASNNEIRGRITAADDGSGLPGVNIVIKGTTVGTVSDAIGEFVIPLTADARTLVISFVGMQTQEIEINGRSRLDVVLNSDATQLSEVAVTGYGVGGYDNSSISMRGISSYEPRVRKTIVATPVVRQTNVEYTLDELYSVKSDGELRMVEMIEYEVDALYQYYAVPKLDLDAFLVARLVNWDQYNLLEGEASLFFEGKYVGKSILDTRNTSDTLSLSLGRDKNVMISRDKVKDLTSRNILSSQRKAAFAYEIKIRNKKQQAIDIRIEDQIPVPNTKDIVVDKQEDTNADFNDETGILTWNRKIAAGKTESINLRYQIKYPRYGNIILE